MSDATTLRTHKCYPDITLVRVYSSSTTRLEHSSSLFPTVVPCYPLLLLLYYLVGISEGYVYEGCVYCSKIHNRSGLGACVSETCMM